MKRPALAVVLIALQVACSRPGPMGPDAGLQAMDGTLASAMRLSFTASVFQDRGSTHVRFCLGPAGPCVPQINFEDVDGCRAYSNIQADLNGVAIPLTNPGRLVMDSGRIGCTYPVFDLETPSAVLSGSGEQTFTFHIGGETARAAVRDWPTTCTLNIPGGMLVGGTLASVAVDPTLSTGLGTTSFAFDYDDPAVQEVWYSNLGRGLRRGESNDGLGVEVPPSAWSDAGLTFRVPVTLPTGTGTLTLEESLKPLPTSCPFSDCTLTGARACTAKGVAIIQPPHCPAGQELCCFDEFGDGPSCACANTCPTSCDFVTDLCCGALADGGCTCACVDPQNPPAGTCGSDAVALCPAFDAGAQ